MCCMSQEQKAACWDVLLAYLAEVRYGELYSVEAKEVASSIEGLANEIIKGVTNF